MKKSLIIIIALLLTGIAGFAQLTGIKTIPGTYPSIATAIADLNAVGVGAGGVTFNIAAGYTETFATPTDGLITATNSLATNPIIFQKSGTGANPMITGATGGGNYDYIICIGGTDYVTFDGIDVRDNPANTDVTPQMEWGYALLRASLTDGTQHAIIKNCSISLVRENTNSCGIYCFRSLYTDPGTPVGVTSEAGTNSNNGFYNLYISNCYSGIYLYGSYPPAPYILFDRGNDIGSLGANTITNFGASIGTCNGIYAQNENEMIVANTTISGIVEGSSCNAMQFQSTSNASVYVYGNTISIQYNGTGTFYGIKDWMGSTAAGGTVIYHDNTITGCTFPSGSGTCSYFDIGHGGSNVSVYNNTVTNNTCGSASTASSSSVVYMGVGGYPGQLGTCDVYNNTISNNIRLQSTPSGGSTDYLSIGMQCNTLNCYGNVCDNNISATTGTARGIICYALRPVTKNIYGNSFTNLSNANGPTYGIYVDAGYNWNIYKNKVLNIIGPGANSVINGIYLGSLTGAGNIYLYNNIVGDLKTSTATSSTAVKGIWLFGWNSNLAGIYNNSIFLDASSAGTNFGTSGLSLSKFSKELDIRNNIIVNTSAPNGTGKTVVLLTDSLNFGNLATTSNNNDYYVGTPSAKRLIFFDGTTGDSTLLQYRTRVYPREYLSVAENPTFVSSVTPVDLHLDNTVPTQCESGGSAVSVPLAITDDYDGNPRYPYTGYPVNPTYPANAPDIGADEFGGIPRDLTPPYIAYAPFANIATTFDRILTATITDVHGVPVSGIGLPRACWKKNYNGLWTYITGTSIGNNQYTFTFGTGTALGDTVYYFVVAQDLWTTPNVGSHPYPANGYSANPPAANPPAFPNKYVVVSPICGTFNVGTGGTYSTLTAAINDINLKGITCPITLVLTDNIYSSETYPIIFHPNGGSSPVNTLTIRPQAGKQPIFAGVSIASGLLKVNGFDYLIIDGSPDGGSEKKLKFYNASETAGAHVIGLFNKGGIDPANHITIRNLIIRGVSSTTVTNYGILLDPLGGGYDDIIITGDSIYGANTGIQFTGNFSGINHNGQILNNVIGSSASSNYITVKGILLQYSDNTLISNNNIMGAAIGNTVPLHSGVYILGGTTNTKIRKNLIHDFYRNADDGSGAFGIWYESDNSTVTEISNNSIYGIKSSGAAPGASPNNPYGIYIKSGGNIRILHNSIWLYGNLLSPTDSYDASSSCIGIYQTGSLTNNIEVRNNTLKNSMLGLWGPCPATGRTYAIMTTASDAGNFSVIDNNDYFVNGCRGQIGFMNFNNFQSLSQWKAATGQDVNSLSVDPEFTSGSNLLPTTTAMPRAGSYISTVPSDIDGIVRTNPPDMGAYEFTSSPAIITTTAATNVAITTATLNGSANPLNNNVNLFFDYGTTTNYGSTIAGTPAMISGNSAQPISAALTGLSGNTTYHFRLLCVTFGNVTVYGNDMTFTTTCIAPVAAGAVTGASLVSQGQNGVAYSVTPIANATGYVWTLPSGATIASGANTASITVNFSPTATSGVLSVYGTNSCGNGTVSPNLSITVIPLTLNLQNITVGEGETLCYDAILTIYVAGGVTTFTVYNGGSATMIAGQNIIYYPGTTVNPGGYMHGYITTNDQFCINTTNPVVNAPVEVSDVMASVPEPAKNQGVRVYPNPTSGLFTLEISGEDETGTTNMEIFSMRGEKVFTKELKGNGKYNLSLSGKPVGIYLIRVITGCRTETLRVIRQ